MRPTEHRKSDYARDILALVRMLRRVVTDSKLDDKKRAALESSIRELIRLFSEIRSDVKEKTSA